MKRTLTAIIALAAAAGFASMAQAHTSTTTAPAATAATTPSTAPGNPSVTSPSMTPDAAPRASMQQPATDSSFWSRNISQDEVRQAQQQLQAQGLYRGPVDGKAGPEMQR